MHSRRPLTGGRAGLRHHEMRCESHMIGASAVERGCCSARGSEGNGACCTAILRTWKIWYVAANWMLVQFSIATIIYFNPLIVDAMFQRGHGWGNPSAAKFPSVQARLKHEAKVALISSLLWVPVVIFMLLIAFSSKHFKERNLHCAIPLTVAGVAYMCAPPPLFPRGALFRPRALVRPTPHARATQASQHGAWVSGNPCSNGAQSVSRHSSAVGTVALHTSGAISQCCGDDGIVETAQLAFPLSGEARPA